VTLGVVGGVEWPVGGQETGGGLGVEGEVGEYS